jgi:hypothetical protein
VTVRYAAGPLLLAGALTACLTACGTTPAPGTAPSTATSTAPAGSATATTPNVTPTKGLPPTVTPTDTTGASLVGWAGAGRLYVVTYGSSTCPRVPVSLSVATGNRLTIATRPTSDGPCTMDFGPSTSVVDAPSGLDDTAPLQVTIDGVALTVPPR